MKTKICLMFVACIFICHSLHSDDKEVISLYYQSLMKTIKSDASLIKFDRDNSTAVNSAGGNISREIRQTKDIGEKSRGLFLLGMLKNKSSIRFLIENLEFVNQKQGDVILTELPLVDALPAKQALRKIGLPAIRELGHEFLNSNDPLRRYICLEVIYEINLQVKRGSSEATLFSIAVSCLLAFRFKTFKSSNFSHLNASMPFC